MQKNIRWLIPFILGLFVLSACGTTPITSTEADPTSSDSSSEADAGSLVIYSGRSENLVGPLIEQFEAATGIAVDVRYGSTAEIAATLLEEGDNSPADLFFAQDPGGVGAIANAGLFAPLPDETMNAVKPAFRPSDNLWVGVSGRARVLVYNTDMLTEAELPQDINGLIDPAWAGRVGWAPTNASFQAMVTAMRALWGEEETRAWLEGMTANDTVVYQNNSAIVEAVGTGEIALGLVNHYYLYRFLAEIGEEFPARNYFLPGGGPGSLVMVAGAGRLATGPNEANALTFINYLVSAEAQEYFRQETNEYPVVDDVAPPEGLTPIEELNAAEIELTNLADLQGTTQLLQDVGLLP